MNHADVQLWRLKGHAALWALEGPWTVAVLLLVEDAVARDVAIRADPVAAAREGDGGVGVRLNILEADHALRVGGVVGRVEARQLRAMGWLPVHGLVGACRGQQLLPLSQPPSHRRRGHGRRCGRRWG